MNSQSKAVETLSMVKNPTIQVLAAILPVDEQRYRDALDSDEQVELRIAHTESDITSALSNPVTIPDVLIVDNTLGNVYELIVALRRDHHQLIIILIDKDADFGMPGQADDVSVSPFESDDLLKRIKRLTEERRLETLRADALPPVRAFAKSLRRTGPNSSKQQAAVDAILELGYDYVAFYSVAQQSATGIPSDLKLAAQAGPAAILASTPQTVNVTGSLPGWVATNGQSRIVAPQDTPNHPLVIERHFASGVCVPVGNTLRFGVILACRQPENAITQHNVLMLELVAAQLASALALQDRS